MSVHNDYVAIMKSLGATSANITRLYGRSLLLLGVGATLLGCGLGWALQSAFFTLFGEQLPVTPGPRRRASLRHRRGDRAGMPAVLCLAALAPAEPGESAARAAA